MPRERDGAGGVVRREADVERDTRADQLPDEGRVAGGADAVGDPPGLQPAERLGDRLGASHFPGVDDGPQAEPRQTAIDRGEFARGEGQFVAAEAEADDPGPGVPGVEVEDAVRRGGAEVPDGVEEDPDPSVPPELVPGEDRLDRVPHGRPVEPEPFDDSGRDVDLGVRDSLTAEAGRQVQREEGKVFGSTQQAADVAVEGEKTGEAVEPSAGANRGEVWEEGRARASREAYERGGPDGALEVEVELGLRPEAEGLGGIHGGPSYGTPRREVFTLVPSERLWLRAAALGLDLICLAGGPLLVATLIVFLVVLLAAEPPVGLPRVFRAAQFLFVVLFLLRDAQGASPGKVLLGLSVARADGGPVRPLDSVLRNLPLLVPGLNLLEAVAVVQRPDSRRLGDRLAGTTVGES